MKRILSLFCVLAMVLGMITVPTFATEAETLQDKVDAYTSGTITLTEDAENLTVEANTYIDLNGYSINGIAVAEGATVYVSDSQTDDYSVADGVYGKLTEVTGAVEAMDGYVAIREDSALSFHRVDLAIKSMSLRASVAGVYYTSSFAADEVVSAQVESYGVALSVVEAPTAENLDVSCGYSVLTDFAAGEKSGTLLTGIMDAKNDAETNAVHAAMDIYGRAYIKTADGYTFGAVAVRDLQEQVEAIDTILEELNDTQKSGIVAFYNTYKSAMADWNIPNLRSQQLGDIVITVPVETENGVVTEEITVEADGMSITVPFGALVEKAELTLNVAKKETSDSGIEAAAGETLMPYDVHVEGVSSKNTVPLTVALGKVMPENLNMGNYSIYHVEADGTKEMTLVAADEAFTAHNQYKYTLDGELTLHMATFSEVATLTDDDNIWQGEVAGSFADGNGTAEDPYLIRNADQLAYLNTLVSAGEDAAKASYKLLADIDFGGVKNAEVKGNVWYPIGYLGKGEGTNSAGEETWYTYGGAFMGTFDGNGHKISNIYQNTWIMDGNYDYGYWDEAMGLFGYVYNGTVKNLTMENFSSDGEFTPTGCVAAYAKNSTFENISLVNCNPRVYNTGNGGIVGIGGMSSDTDADELTFNNITIDNSNKITALWGSWDVACGGLIGMFRGAGHVNMNNCHVAAQIDVYNDVCGNYQYYWYRYSGMLIGTNKNMITDPETGRIYPETDKYHALNCTVHFGDWNNYYYCELVANSLASYTHDHQFSRLTEIKSLDEIKTGDIWTTTGNYVLFTDSTRDTKTAECFHIMKNADGNLYRHYHDKADETNPEVTEVVNGETVLKENNQIIYLPFNQLFTGYGWGVNHIPVYNGKDYAFEGVKILDRDEANSVVKFDDVAADAYTTETTVEIGKLFAAKSDAEVAIVPENVQVTVSPAVDTSTASGTYKAAEADENGNVDWTKGTLTFSGIGDAIITITDYYFCTPTTINVKVEKKADVVKFDKLFDKNFLYRVGNQNSVAVGKIFAAAENAEIGSTVKVTVTPVTSGVSGTHTSSTKWTDGTLNFTGTGVVKLSITDGENCEPTELYLEVVDAVNATGATSATANNVVLLNDCGLSSLTVSGRYTFYGNGFTMTYTDDGRYLGKGSGFKFGVVNVSDSGTLDNCRIKCSIYPIAALYSDQIANYYETDGSKTRYFYQLSAVAVSGNATVANCYIYGGRNNLYIGGGDVTVEGTVLENGVLSNAQIVSSNEYTVTFEDVTTIQNLVTPTTYANDSMKNNVLMGAGLVVGSGDKDQASNETNPKINLNGSFKQYNWVHYSDYEDVTDETAKEILGEAYSASEFHHTVNGDSKTVNMGIIFLNNNAINVENNTGLPYATKSISVGGQSGKVYTLKGATPEQIYWDVEKADRDPLRAERSGLFP